MDNAATAILLLHKEIAANAPPQKKFTIRFSFKKTLNYATLIFSDSSFKEKIMKQVSTPENF
ncbi:hypothetical protein FGF66_09235 [Chlorobaculum thiosulfatiphilum]|jgi:hypothetical protein|uniref:Uncharacterized protein n=1 Tax=Chlorobaculum thiosulfatiphilum TaxID=115852 RepID=A0A5C4S4B8_CHLTI|nr:hypothetical protein [Chlorobaculum thiosulfatiphilum]TNJ38343.1 hypothetical protein FGF66_09235 [Chlorobaculum thiosulfatiphilum]